MATPKEDETSPSAAVRAMTAARSRGAQAGTSTPPTPVNFGASPPPALPPRAPSRGSQDAAAAMVEALQSDSPGAGPIHPAPYRPDPVVGERPAPEGRREEPVSAQQPGPADFRGQVEARMRLAPIDVGRFLMSNGEALQHVPILPSLSVDFRSPRVEEMAAMQAYITRLQADPGPITKEEERQRSRELATIGATYGDLALSIHAINGSAWASLTEPSTRETGLRTRLLMVAKMSYAACNLVHRHWQWFMARVEEATTADQLKNG